MNLLPSPPFLTISASTTSPGFTKNPFSVLSNVVGGGSGAELRIKEKSVSTTPNYHFDLSGETPLNKKQKSSATPNGYICHKCNQPGHLIRDCPGRTHNATFNNPDGMWRVGATKFVSLLVLLVKLKICSTFGGGNRRTFLLDLTKRRTRRRSRTRRFG